MFRTGICSIEGETPAGGASSLYPNGGGGDPPAPAAPVVAAPVVEPPKVEAPVDPAAPPASAMSGGDPPPAAPDPNAPSIPAVAPLTAASYEFKFPENFKADDAIMSKVKDIFVEAQVPADKAQALISIYSEQLTNAVKAGVEASRNDFTALQTKWTNELQAMPEFQGEAKKQTSSIIGRAMDEYGSPEAKQAFDLTGAGNNPAIVRMFLKMAAALSEGAPPPGGAPPGGRKGSRAERLYQPKAN